MNGQKVQTLKEFREAVLKPVKDGQYMTFKSKQNELVVLPLKVELTICHLSFQEAVKEEFELSENYMFNVSPLILKILMNNSSLIDYVGQDDPRLKIKIKASIASLVQQEDEDKKHKK